jgi:hypothetical protein
MANDGIIFPTPNTLHFNFKNYLVWISVADPDLYVFLGLLDLDPLVIIRYPSPSKKKEEQT